MVSNKYSLETYLLNNKLDNPVIPASGTFGFGYEFSEFYDINILGSISLKGTTLNARYGNEQPRIADCPSGMLNAIGLQNPGAEAVAEVELNKLRKVYNKKPIVNIGGHSTHEYTEAVRIFEKCKDEILCIELNISCPNVKGGGMAFGTDAKTIEKLVSDVKAVTDIPLMVKLSPNVTCISDMASAAENGGADAISAINTLVGMRIDLRLRKPVLSTVTGGYSGPGVFPVALKMVRDIRKAVSIPVVGMGGISDAYGVIEMMMAGADAVMIGSANLINPFVCKEIIEDLPKVMQELNISSLASIIGVGI